MSRIGLLLWVSMLFAASMTAATAQNLQTQPEPEEWTGIIPDRFPHNVYTWRLSADGTYEEDAVESASGRSAQPTFSGCWRAYGEAMVLRQNGIGYLFMGTVRGMDYYAGTLFLNGRPFSRFCATKGPRAPKACEPRQEVETNSPQFSCERSVAASGVLRSAGDPQRRCANLIAVRGSAGSIFTDQRS